MSDLAALLLPFPKRCELQTCCAVGLLLRGGLCAGAEVVPGDTEPSTRSTRGFCTWYPCSWKHLEQVLLNACAKITALKHVCVSAVFMD